MKVRGGRFFPAPVVRKAGFAVQGRQRRGPGEHGRAQRKLLVLASILLGLYGELIRAQVINFDVPGGAGAVNYSGQGGYPDPGKNYWNPIVGGGTAGATNRLSDGVTPSPITLTSQLGGTYGTQGAQGTPAGFQQPYQYLYIY